MIIADLFMYTVYNFLTKRLHRDKEIAGDSAILYLSAVISFLIIDIITSSGIIYENRISRIFHRGGVLSYLIIFGFTAIFFYIRYKYISIQSIEERLSSIKTNKLKILKIITIFLVVITIAWFFILCYIN